MVTMNRQLAVLSAMTRCLVIEPPEQACSFALHDTICLPPPPNSHPTQARAHTHTVSWSGTMHARVIRHHKTNRRLQVIDASFSIKLRPAEARRHSEPYLT